MSNIIGKIAIKNKFMVMAVWCLTVAAAVAGSVTAQSDKQYLPVPAGTVFTRDVKYFSESGNHYLVFQADGNLVVYDKGGRFTWGVNSVSDKFRQAAKAEFRQNGSFGLFDAKGTSVWSPPGTAAFLTIRDNGSLQLIAKDGSAVWTSDVASTVKLAADASALDLKANLVGTWSGGNPKLIISQDRITAEENGQVKWSGKYTVTGKDTIAITYDDGRKVNAEMIVSERQQGPKLVKRLRWNVNNEMGGSNQWESAESGVKRAVPVYTDRQTITGDALEVNSLAFSPDGKTFASGSRDGTIKLWNAADGKEIRTFSGHTDAVWSVAFSPTGKTLASASGDDTIKLWNAADGKEIRTLTGHKGNVLSVAFSPDGKMLVSGSVDRSIRLWNAVDGKEIRTFTEHKGSVNSVAFSPDGKMLVSGSDDRSIRLWNAGDGKEIRAVTNLSSGVTTVAFSRDGKMFANAFRRIPGILWNVADGNEIYKLDWSGPGTFWTTAIVFSPDGKMLATAGIDDIITLSNVADGKNIQSLKGHAGGISSLAFSPDGKILVSGSDNTKVIKLWRAE